MGVIGKVGTILGEQDKYHRHECRSSKDGFGALMVISTQNAVNAEISKTLINTDGVTQCSIINLPEKE